MTTQKIVPNIWCNGNAEEAGNFYASVFPGATSEVESRYPETNLLDFQRELAGQPLTVTVEIDGTRLTLINAGDEFSPGPAISIMLNFDPSAFGGDEPAARERLDQIWQALAKDGTVLMELGEYPFSRRYGWIEDRFGVSWQLILTQPEGEPRPLIIPALMFAGDVQNRAAEAVDRYLEVFDDAELGNRIPYVEQAGPAVPGAVLFSDFRIGDQWFVAMDAAAEGDMSFSCGVSLEVQCEDQAEIDRLWEALSAVPEAEQCGWLADEFGVSWQIVPSSMAELMQRPGAYEHMMGMKKLVIDDF